MAGDFFAVLFFPAFLPAVFLALFFAGDFFAAFLALFFAVFLALFFAGDFFAAFLALFFAVFLALFFAGDFFAAFLPAVFLALFFAGDFFAAFLALLVVALFPAFLADDFLAAFFLEEFFAAFFAGVLLASAMMLSASHRVMRDRVWAVLLRKPRQVNGQGPPFPTNMSSQLSSNASPTVEVDALSELHENVARWLTTASGLGTVASATARLDAGEDTLSIASNLRRDGVSGDRCAGVLGAAVARRRARERWPDADRLLFTRESLEQASDPEVATWRARRFPEAVTVMDVCAGIGGDALAIGARGVAVTAVEVDTARLHLLRHNADVREVELTTIAGDALAVQHDPTAWLHADPSRRDAARRVHTLRGYQPSVPALLAHHAAAPGSGIVLSPAVDLTDPDLPAGELEFIQRGGVLAESIVWLGSARRTEVVASATLLPAGEHRQRVGPPVPLEVGPVEDHLIEVAPAAVRARLHGAIGEQIGAHRLARRRALLTSSERPAPSPWYRISTVEAVLSARPKVVRAWLRNADPLPLEIASHGLAADPGEWWRALGTPPRGPQGRRLDLIRTDDGAIAVTSRWSPR